MNVGTRRARDEDTPEKILAGMILEDKVSQMMVVSLRGWTAVFGAVEVSGSLPVKAAE